MLSPPPHPPFYAVVTASLHLAHGIRPSHPPSNGVSTTAAPPLPPSPIEDRAMQDLVWIGVTTGLALLTFAYIALCDRA